MMRKVKNGVLAEIFNDLSIMLEAEMSLVNAVNTLIESAEPRSAGFALLKDIKEHILGGENLSEALEKSGIPNGIPAVVMCGERSGKLPQMLKKLSLNIANAEKNKNKLGTALIYPTFVFVFTMAAAWYMLKFLVPKFTIMLAETSGNALPAITLAVMAASDFIDNHGFIFFIVLTCFCIAVKWLVANPLKLTFDKMLLQVPIMGKIIRQTDSSAFYSTLSFLLEAGMDMPSALELGCQTVKNSFMKEEFLKVISAVKDNGSSLSDAIKLTASASATEKQALSVAEKSGCLCRILQKLAEELNEKTDEQMKRLTKLFEPIMIIIVGAIVGVIMLAMYMPMVAMIQI